ncbi:DUF924 family protein [Marilutibacter maris]|uniref:DUF924 family protein n=1 Tax=Marilutibacter maris TaxID=1605891 RepID=A0A2U9TAM3_9GAMM|nr:DUF924 family protein [Lysobacter maris]AWV08652.1 hypothetical protein C9I47_2983 [Lysobacter maris]
MNVTAKEVVDFWRDAGPERWFAKDETFDDMCEMAFEDAMDDAAAGKGEAWMKSAEGALALVLLLDQMPRNIHRGTARAFAYDEIARRYAGEAVDRGYDAEIDPALRAFFYLPFEHSEDIGDQERSVELHRNLEGEGADKWAVLHKEIIERFGRFPHRNAVLGRDTTPEEQAWLDAGGFKG